jgi:hypothetical protein
MLILATKCVVKLIEFQCEGIALLSLLICFYAAVNFHLLLSVFNKTFKAEKENISSGLEICSHTLSKALLTSQNIKHISSRLSSAINISLISFISWCVVEWPGRNPDWNLYNEIFMALDNRELICLIFCDVSKAFDRVWLRGLLLKLERYGIKGNLLQWLGSYISAREQQEFVYQCIFHQKIKYMFVNNLLKHLAYSSK